VYARSCCSDCSATLCAFFKRNLSCFWSTVQFASAVSNTEVRLNSPASSCGPSSSIPHTQGEFRLIVSLHVLLGFVPLPHLAQSPAGGVVSDIFILHSLNILRWVLSREIDILIRRGLRRLWVLWRVEMISRSCLQL
jgi:hypothetical protein